MDKLVVRGTEINVQWALKRDDFLSLTDIAKIRDSDNPRYIIIASTRTLSRKI